MSNAKSFVNRNKKFELDNQLPNENNVLLRMNPKFLTHFQLYLWQWCEIELRLLRFLKVKNISRFYELYNTDVDSPVKIGMMLDFFSIEHHPVEFLKMVPRVNTNLENGFDQTQLTKKDFVEFESFLDMLPSNIHEDLPSLNDWHQTYKAGGFHG